MAQQPDRLTDRDRERGRKGERKRGGARMNYLWLYSAVWC